MQSERRFTVLSLLGPNQRGRRIAQPRGVRWLPRRDAKLSDRLLAYAVGWPVAVKGSGRPDLRLTTL